MTAKNVEIAVVDLTRTRAHELIRIKHLMESPVIKFFKSLKPKSSGRTYLLNERELIEVCLLLQLRGHWLRWAVNMASYNGGTLVVIMHCVLSIFAAMPFFFLLLFLGLYSRRGYIRVWECVPILKGIGYAAGITEIMVEIFNVRAAGLGVLYLYNTFFDAIPWKDCNFPRATNSCVPRNPEKPFLCEKGKIKDVASWEYLKYHLRNDYESFPMDLDILGPIKTDWAIAVWIVWFIVLICMISGFNKFVPIFSKLCRFVAAFMLLIVTITVAVNYQSKWRHVMDEDVENLFRSEFWFETLIFALDGTSPATVIYLAAVTPSTVLPLATALRVFLMKIAIVTVYLLWLVSATNMMMDAYNVPYKACFGLTSTLTLFAFIPDALASLPAPQMWLLMYYFSLTFIFVASPVYTLAAALNCLIQVFPKLSKIRVRTALVLFLISGSLTMLTVTRASPPVQRTWTFFGLPFLRLTIALLTSLAIIFLYTIGKLLNDYAFTYNDRPTKFWIYSWKLLPAMCVFCLVCVISRSVMIAYDLSKVPVKFKAAIHWVCIIPFLPLLWIILVRYLKNMKSKEEKCAMFESESTWGPLSEKKRWARQLFNPQRELGYQMKELRCSHACLVSSVRYSRELASQSMHYQTLLERSEGNMD